MLHVNKETRGRKFIVDEHLKVCTICKHVWEKVSKRLYTKSYEIYPYGVIPTIGKERKICPRCTTTPNKLSHASKRTANVFAGVVQNRRLL